MPDTLFFLIFGHFLGDYALQTDNMAKRKSASLSTLSLHVLIYTITVGFFWWLGTALNARNDFWRLTVAVVLGSLYLAHWLQDFLKSRYFNNSKQSYYLDQAVHLGILYLIRILL
jgi:hypothetical protein